MIPRYAGVKPHIPADNCHVGKTIAEQSREVFNQALDEPRNSFASTGFNSGLIPSTEAELHATSRRFGTETRVRTAPNMHPSNYRTTTTRASYFPPGSRFKNNWRQRDTSVVFDNSPLLKIKPLQSDRLASGYSTNRQLWDGTFWRTEKNTHTDQQRTLYRMKFVQAKPFHKAELRNSDGRLRLAQKIYDTADK